MRRIGAVFVGGVLGTWARYAVGLALASGPGWTATLCVNAVGSFLIAALYVLSRRSAQLGPLLQAGLGVGFLGGFTTYATFNLEVLRLLRRSEIGWAVGYVALMLVTCITAGVAGQVVMRGYLGRHDA